MHTRVGYRTGEKRLFTIQYLYIEFYDCELYGSDNECRRPFAISVAFLLLHFNFERVTLGIHIHARIRDC